MNATTAPITLAAFCERLTPAELIAETQNIQETIKASAADRSAYYARHGKYSDLRKEVEPLTAYVREIFAGQDVVVLWDEKNEWFDARIFANKTDLHPQEYVQLTLTNRLVEEARLDRIAAAASSPANSKQERLEQLEKHIKAQASQPEFLMDANEGLYSLLVDTAVAATKKLRNDYSDAGRSVIVIGLDLPPLFEELLAGHGELLKHIAWSLTHLTSNVDDIYLVTWPERYAVSVNECRESYELDLRFQTEEYANSLSPTLPRQNESGYLAHVQTNLRSMLKEIGNLFFPDKITSNDNDMFKHSVLNQNSELDYIVAEWSVPLINVRNKLTGEDKIALRIIFSKDFCEAMAARDVRVEVAQIRLHIQRFLFRYVAAQVQQRAADVKTLAFGSLYFE